MGLQSAPQQGHINFFQQLEDGEVGDGKTNKEHEEEKKKEQEEYEKKVGYLTYLGQDTEELTGEQVWWKKLPINRKGNEPMLDYLSSCNMRGRPTRDINEACYIEPDKVEPALSTQAKFFCEHESYCPGGCTS